MSTVSEEERLLEQLLLDEKFEQLSSERAFNVFEALGMVRAEIRHSHFLASLLDPNGAHGVGNGLLRELLLEVCREHPTFRPADVLLSDFDDAIVERERDSIDILVTVPSLKLVCAIENKIASAEHSNQLVRYREIVDRRFPGWHRLLVYLTSEGDLPSDETYTPLSYTFLLASVERLAQRVAAADIKLVLNHYAELLRAHIVPNDRLIELCRGIYKRHSQALELIMEHGVTHRDDRLVEIVEEVFDAQLEEERLTRERCSARTFRFAAPELEAIPAFMRGSWSPEGRILLCELCVRANKIELVVTLGPGDAPTRVALHKALQAAGFRQGRLYDKWYRVWAEDVVTPQKFETFDPNDAIAEASTRQAIAAAMKRFRSEVLPRLVAATQQADREIARGTAD